MKRAGTADEVAQAILWLLSDEASYTTGAISERERRPLTGRNVNEDETYMAYDVVVIGSGRAAMSAPSRPPSSG